MVDQLDLIIMPSVCLFVLSSGRFFKSHCTLGSILTYSERIFLSPHIIHLSLSQELKMLRKTDLSSRTGRTQRSDLLPGPGRTRADPFSLKISEENPKSSHSG